MLFVDIETRAHPQAEFFLPEFSAPSNYKDPDKIDLYIQGKKAEALDKAALDQDLGQIVSLAYQVDLGGVPTVEVAEELDGGETELLKIFWDVARESGGQLVGYNILDFDIPFLMRRSMALGVFPTMVISQRRYTTDPVKDLMQILFNWGRETYRGLKWVAGRYELEVLAPEMEGSQVAGMSADELRLYGQSDLHLLTQLYTMMNGVYWPDTSRPGYTMGGRSS